MKYYLAVLFVLLIGISSNAQPMVSPALQEVLQAPQQPALLQVNVFLNDQVAIHDLAAQLDAQSLTVGERATAVRRALQQKAQESQAQLLAALQGSRTPSMRVLSQHWLVNMIALEASPAAIRSWTGHADIAYIQLYDEEKAYLIEPVEERMASAKRSPGGTEPGLLAIRADELWKMGYSGHGQKALIYDTGIRMNHPAVKERFLYFNYPGRYGWNPIDQFYPADKSSTHGTHVAGTVLGLDPATNDTIGVAPGARFMATDPIVDDLSKIKPLPVYISVYEWIFNPDGDTATTDDVPIVINNSWGLASSDTTLCNSFASDMFDALQAAGIAVVFSAGNNGPDPETVGRPAFINSGLVNVFAVGALNGNDPNYPIASFSSRGPTICNGSGQLKIKPEVSAPGFQVRSAVFDDQYALYNGTSMAAPHVSGAVLLLAEAYPMATGKELLEALYWSAVDLGAPGEDNTYGRGIIDVKAAYDTLAKTFTPVAPMQRTHDLAVTALLSPAFSLHCVAVSHAKPAIAVEAVVGNLGSTDAVNPVVTLWDGERAVDTVALPLLVAGQSDTVSFTIEDTLSLGLNEWLVRIDWDQPTTTDYDPVDNQQVVRFDYRGVVTNSMDPSYRLIDFDTVRSLYGGPFLVEGFDDKYSWVLDTVKSGTDWSVKMELSDYLPRANQRDFLYLPYMQSIPDVARQLSFDYYYRTKASLFVDSLIVEVSEDCGATWQRLFADGGVNLNSSAVRDPADPTNWQTITTPIFDGGIIRFVAVNDNGGDLYIDNIRVDMLNSTATIAAPLFTVYPNPATDQLTVVAKSALASQGGMLSIINLSGQTVREVSMTGGSTLISLAGLPKGVYLVQWQDDRIQQTQSFVKQ